MSLLKNNSNGNLVKQKNIIGQLTGRSLKK